MNAVWSFWSKPYLASRKTIWCSEKQHLLSWILSLELARKFFEKTVLFTDDYGARMLVDGLRLEFDCLSTALNGLDHYDQKWWALGKIHTYASQKEPFIHIDNDAFLWKPLPIDSNTPLFAQNPDYFTVGASYYMPEQVESLIRKLNGWLPKEWAWYRTSGLPQRAESCGIFGGSNTEFINHYAKQAFETVEHRANANLWAILNDRVERNILVEQYLLSACIEYHKNHSDGWNRPIEVSYLFESLDDAFDPVKAEEAGYTHLVADAKKNKSLAQDIEQRVRMDHPEAYENCLRYVHQTKS